MQTNNVIITIICNIENELKTLPFYLYHSIYKYKYKHVKTILVLQENCKFKLPNTINLLIKNNLLKIIYMNNINKVNVYNTLKNKFPRTLIHILDNNKKIYSNELVSSILKPKTKILCADVGDEENNGFALFKHLYENYKKEVETFYITDNKKILEQYPNNTVTWSKKHEMIKWCDTICHSYENFADVSKKDKTKIFLQHGITWANSNKYISHILQNSTFATCTVKRELNYFNSLNTSCRCILTGMPIYDYDLSKSKNGKNIVIMFTYRSNLQMNWMQSFINSPELKTIHKEYGYNIYFVKHHHPNTKKINITLPDYIISKPISELGNLVRISNILITDYSSISFKAAYLNKSVYYYQPDYNEYCKDPVKSKGWFNWKTEYLGYRSESKQDIFNTLIKEIEGTYVNKINKNFFSFNDNNNADRICKFILNL